MGGAGAHDSVAGSRAAGRIRVQDQPDLAQQISGLEMTLDRARILELPVTMLIPLDDVDRPDDLRNTELRMQEDQ